jgi:hypothetical protein
MIRLILGESDYIHTYISLVLKSRLDCTDGVLGSDGKSPQVAKLRVLALWMARRISGRNGS